MLVPQPLTVYCVYRGGQRYLDVYELLNHATIEHTFVGGDFNAHHEKWGSSN